MAAVALETAGELKLEQRQADGPDGLAGLAGEVVDGDGSRPEKSRDPAAAVRRGVRLGVGIVPLVVPRSVLGVVELARAGSGGERPARGDRGLDGGQHVLGCGAERGAVADEVVRAFRPGGRAASPAPPEPPGPAPERSGR